VTTDLARSWFPRRTFRVAVSPTTRLLARLFPRVVMLLFTAQAAFAQTAGGEAEPRVTGYLQDNTRFESWSFFDPPPTGADPTYRTVGNRITLGVRLASRRFDVDGAVQYSQLLNLPEDSIGPGALGSGALYYFSAEAPAAYQAYFKTMWLRLKGGASGLSLTAGRMPYSSGEETASGNAGIDEVTNRRIGSRMIGTFETSMFDRAFDGGRLDLDRHKWSAGASILFPTQGAYEESANPTITSLRVLTASATLKPALVRGQQLQLFGYHYRDRREIGARPDNVVSDPRGVDIDITTVGASQVGVFDLAGGHFDTLLWIAGQTGDWYGLDHSAASVAIEGGYRWDSGWRPWIRAGYLYASGDSAASDDQHGTFFQMVPSIQRYAPSETYALMNLRDTFAELALEPHPRVSVRAAVHRLLLADAADRWYYGSGATSMTGGFFGFATRPSRGAVDLGVIGEGFVDVSITRPWSVNAYLGLMRGGEVVRRSFSGDRLLFFTVQNILRF
jgi:hypothetical protein